MARPLTLPSPLRGEARARRLTTPAALLPLLLLAVTAASWCIPVAMVVYGSFRDAAPGQAGAFTLDNWRDRARGPRHVPRARNSILIAVPRTVLALALATAFAWCLARTNTPVQRLLEGLLVFMFFLPELPWVLAWMLLGAPNVGLLNQWLRLLVAGRGELRQRLLVRRAHRAGRRPLGAGPVPVHPPRVPGDGRDAGGGRPHGRGERWRTIWRVNLPLLLPALPGVGHPLVRGGDGVVRDPAAPGHAGEDLRVHHAHLRPRLRRPRRALRPRHGAGRAAADPHRAA